MKVLRKYIKELIAEETIAIGQCYPHAVKMAQQAPDEEWDDWAEIEKHDSFNCPLTLNRMKDPVSTVDGHTYERSAIEEWLVDHDTSPMTGLTLGERVDDASTQAHAQVCTHLPPLPSLPPPA